MLARFGSGPTPRVGKQRGGVAMVKLSFFLGNNGRLEVLCESCCWVCKTDKLAGFRSSAKVDGYYLAFLVEDGCSQSTLVAYRWIVKGVRDISICVLTSHYG